MRQHRTEEEKKKILEEARRTRMSQAKFCKCRAISVSTLRRWQKEAEAEKDEYARLKTDQTKVDVDFPIGNEGMRVNGGIDLQKLVEAHDRLAKENQQLRAIIGELTHELVYQPSHLS